MATRYSGRLTARKTGQVSYYDQKDPNSYYVRGSGDPLSGAGNIASTVLRVESKHPPEESLV